MKTKTQIAVIFAIICTALLAMGATHVSSRNYQTSGNEQWGNHEMAAADRFKVVKVEGCEYVLWINGHGSNMVHHGNCKQCTKK